MINIINIITSILGTIISSIFYRMGGAGSQWGKDNKLWRRIGVPLVVTLVSFVLGIHNPIVLLLSFGLLVGSLSSYEGNFYVHGLLCGLATLPIAYITGHWWLFVLRCVILSIWAGLWSKYWNWDIAEEMGRLLPLIPTLSMIL